jgi:hypothetical protein
VIDLGVCFCAEFGNYLTVDGYLAGSNQLLGVTTGGDSRSRNYLL